MVPKPVKPKWLQVQENRDKLGPTLIADAVNIIELQANNLPISFGKSTGISNNKKNNDTNANIDNNNAKHVRNQRTANVTVPDPATSNHSGSDSSDDDIGPIKPQSSSATNQLVTVKPEPVDDNETNNNENEEINDFIDSVIAHYRLPITHESILHNDGHSKSVTSITTNTNGTLVMSGSIDGSIKQWNYIYMNQQLQCSNAVTQRDDMTSVQQITINSLNEYMLCITASMQPKLYTMDCKLHNTFARGDVYQYDQKNTAGHTGVCIAGMFHPVVADECMTCGVDGVIRIWNIHNTNKNKYVLKLRGVNKGIHITACTYCTNGTTIVCASNDGNLHIFTAPINSNRISTVIHNAHTPHTDVTALLFINDHTFVSRGDDCIKVWNIHDSQHPINTINNLPNTYTQTNMSINKDHTVLITPIHDTMQYGKLVFIDCHTWTQIITMNIEPLQHGTVPCNIIQCQWNHVTNNIHLSCSDSTIRVLYSPQYSHGGIMNCLHKQAKKRRIDLYNIQPKIFAPNAIPDGQSHYTPISKQSSNDSADEIILDKRGKSFGSNIDANHMAGILINRNKAHEANTRESMLSYANEPLLYTAAYKHTQPHTILQQYAEPETEEQQRSKLGRFK